MRHFCGNEPSPLRGEVHVVALGPDASHRANIPRSFGAIAVFLVIFVGAACSERIEYAKPSAVIVTADAININTATSEELEQLPRIGPKTAANIIKFRSENGPFRRPEEVMQVHGISEKRFLEIRQYLRTE